MRQKTLRIWIGAAIAGAGFGAGLGALERASDVTPPAVVATVMAREPVAPRAMTPAPAFVPPVQALPPTEPLPAWRQFAVAAPPADGRPRIAVVIDDLGVQVPNARRVIELPGPLTLSLMTYALNLPQLAEAGRAHGHELMLHVPMEPEQAPDLVAPGPNALTTDLSAAELRKRMQWALDRVPGVVGINNHMGSKFSADRGAMTVVMQELAARGLLFLDSLTTNHSVGRVTSRAAGVSYVARDVFLDNEDTVESVRAQIRVLEATARRDGSAIAIAHPKAATIEVLRAWLPTLAARGFVLVPLTALVEVEAPVSLVAKAAQ